MHGTNSVDTFMFWLIFDFYFRGILHNPEMYPKLERFNPDRFIKGGILNRDILDPLSIAFGFGRRLV